MKTLIITSIFGLAVILTGCQSAEQVAATETSNYCPACKVKTTTILAKNLKSKQMICPRCKTTWTIDDNIPGGEWVHSCDRCGKGVATCDKCRGKL